ncbi:hypothetical protein BaRGS_00010103 [Batillaria attramentaria]|uniref:Alpha-carbonic anhydrase domain-containing protein n=1 Tax=Batillaria attramentaria TaxID=370345 RepID=A0ABD0LHJ6_9CAEN
MKGLVMNTGNDITVELQGEGYNCVNISLGPLSYRYRAAQLKFHFANTDTRGSEHLIAGKSFPVEFFKGVNFKPGVCVQEIKLHGRHMPLCSVSQKNAERENNLIYHVTHRHTFK